MFRFLVFILCVSSLKASPLQDPVEIVPIRNLGPRIINGEPAEEGQLPWQVAILGSSATIPRYLCGGSLISAEWVLTAGHCIDGARSATIYAGSTVFDSTDATRVAASDFILHEDFDGTYLTNDIGLIKLQTPLKGSHIKPIALADELLSADSTVRVSGWGSISDSDPNPYNKDLLYVDIQTIENSACARIYGNAVVYPGLVCTASGTPIKGPCLGDSGGPVVEYDDDKKPVQVAIFSFVNGYGCEFPYPAGYTRTAYYREWIKEKTGI